MRSMFAVVARELREKYGETLQSMAEEFGVSFQYLSLLETCKGKSLRRITPTNAERYRNFFLRCGATKEELEGIEIGLLVHNGRIVVNSMTQRAREIVGHYFTYERDTRRVSRVATKSQKVGWIYHEYSKRGMV